MYRLLEEYNLTYIVPKLYQISTRDTSTLTKSLSKLSQAIRRSHHAVQTIMSAAEQLTVKTSRDNGREAEYITFAKLVIFFTSFLFTYF